MHEVINMSSMKDLLESIEYSKMKSNDWNVNVCLIIYNPKFIQ